MSKQQPEVNYIRHLNAIMDRLADDERITPFHVSLYMALFSRWNRNRFRNPLIIQRDEIMYLSKIRSNKTYLSCMKDLHEFGFIQYQPSFSAMQGTRVHLFTIDIAGTQLPMQDLFTKDIGLTQHTYIENKHKENSKKMMKEPPEKNEVVEFFKIENYPEVEAEKFFNYFESNGWKVGGKTTMKNWHAAARNWMLNIKKFNPSKDENPKPGKLNTGNDKNYGEPL
jgi:hypothetical protein